VAGCVGTSRPSRFYTLAPAEVRENAVPAERRASLAIGPVEIPDYLDRQQIVTRTGENELVLSEFDRWGGSLEREISSSLLATVANRLAPRGILVLPWRAMPAAHFGGAYRVSIAVSRFDGALRRSVVLRGRWQLVRERNGSEEFLAVTETAIAEPVAGGDYEALVAAMQRALARFGVELADFVAAAAEVAKAP
jgi:uncharacterized protein